MSKHTPGPWVAKYREVFAAETGLQIKDAVKYSEYRLGKFAYKEALEQEIANARLIAAAPDILAALEQIVRAVDRMPGNNPLEGLADNARAAIAKAKGK